MKPTLTFIIPTYNRVRFLEQGLNRLQSEVEAHQFQNEVEIIVGNNCSIDGTDVFLNQWVQENSALNVKIHHHNTNLGAVKNLVFLVREAKGEFWMFYGDDDFIPKNAMPKVLFHLKNYKDFPIHIFNQSINKPIEKLESISLNACAKSYFYYMGNACTIAKTSESQELIKKYKKEILLTCWPQTHIFFLVGVNSKKEHPVITNPAIIYEEQKQELNNIFNSFRYFDSAIYALLKLSYILKKQDKRFKSIHFKAGITQLRRGKHFLYVCKCVLFSYKLIDTRREREDFRSLYKESLITLKPKDKFILFPYFLVFIIPKSLYKLIYILAYAIFKNGHRSIIDKMQYANQQINEIRKNKRLAKQYLHSHTAYQNEW